MSAASAHCGALTRHPPTALLRTRDGGGERHTEALAHWHSRGMRPLHPRAPSSTASRARPAHTRATPKGLLSPIHLTFCTHASVLRPALVTPRLLGCVAMCVLHPVSPTDVEDHISCLAHPPAHACSRAPPPSHTFHHVLRLSCRSRDHMAFPTCVPHAVLDLHTDGLRVDHDKHGPCPYAGPSECLPRGAKQALDAYHH